MFDAPGAAIPMEPWLHGPIVIREPRYIKRPRTERQIQRSWVAKQLSVFFRQCSYKDAPQLRCMALGVLNFAEIYLKVISFSERVRLERWVASWK